MPQYLVLAQDGTDAEASGRRMNVRPLHLEGARHLKENNNFIIGGAMLDNNDKMIGSMMVVQFVTEEELKAWMDREPYITGMSGKTLR